MKSIFTLLLFTLLLLISCGTTPTQPSINCNCPVPYGSDRAGFGPKLPRYAHYDFKLSHDGKKLGFSIGDVSVFKILDLENGKVTAINLQDYLPPTVIVSTAKIADWCPYDPNTVLISATTSTDTNNSGKYFYGCNLYTLSLISHEIRRFTPMQFGKIGTLIICEFPIQWLHSTSFGGNFISSTKGNDYIEIFSSFGFGGIYHVQSGTLSSNLRLDFVQYPSKPKDDNRFSGNKPYFREIINRTGYNQWFIRDVPLRNPGYLCKHRSWSPSNQYLALALSSGGSIIDEQEGSCGYQEIWIYDVNELSAKGMNYPEPIRKINLRKEFCMYNTVVNCSAEFLTDSTLAVSMHKDGDDFAPIWEISIDGKLLRQLTFEP